MTSLKRLKPIEFIGGQPFCIFRLADFTVILLHGYFKLYNSYLLYVRGHKPEKEEIIVKRKIWRCCMAGVVSAVVIAEFIPALPSSAAVLSKSGQTEDKLNIMEASPSEY